MTLLGRVCTEYVWKNLKIGRDGGNKTNKFSIIVFLGLLDADMKILPISGSKIPISAPSNHLKPKLK